MAEAAKKKPAEPSSAMLDSLTNLISGMGTERDKRSFTSFVFNPMNREQLDAAYRTDWIARKVVDIPAFDATREWREWQADKEQITALEDAEASFMLLQKVKTALIKSRLYGGGALILGVQNGQAQDELLPESVQKGQLKFVHSVSRWELSAGPLQLDITSPYYGEPQWYQRNATGQVPLRIHPSRVVRLLGLEPADLLTSGADSWGDPILQVCQDAIMACGTVINAISSLVDESKIDVISIPDLTAQIANKDYEDRLKKRFGLAATAKSIYKMLLLDKEETWQRITTSFSGMDNLIHIYLTIVAGAADIPVTRMIGQSPKGMNATGENDTRNYYDKVATEQKTVLTPVLSRLDEVLIRSVLGSRPPELTYNWRSLWQLDEAASALVGYQKAQAFQIDAGSGIIDPQVLREARQNQLIEDGTYPGLEAAIEEFQNDMEDLSPDAQAAKNVATASLTAGQGLPTDPVAKSPAPKPPSSVIPANANDSADRIRKALSDAEPRTLYVYRPVLNWKELADWAKANGFTTTVGSEMHVTIAYSMKAVDWMKAGDEWPSSAEKPDGSLTINSGGVRLIEKLGNAVVLMFASYILHWRWCQIKDNTGAEWSWPDYQPHITLTYDPPGGLDTYNIEAYTGPIVLGAEVFEQVKPGNSVGIIEDAKAGMTFGRKRAKIVPPTPAGITKDELTDALSTALADRAPAPPPNITVPVTIHVPRKGKETTKVTAYSKDGRISEFERSEEEDE